MYCKGNEFVKSLRDFFKLTGEEIRECNFTEEEKNFFIVSSVLVILVFFSAFAVFYRLILDTENFVMISLQFTHVGKKLCPACKEKAAGVTGFVEEFVYTAQFRKTSLVNLKFFNSFGVNNDSRFHMELDTDDCVQYLTIHDCGCLQNIGYELLSLHHVGLLCQPSKYYQNVFIERNESAVLDSVKSEYTRSEMPIKEKRSLFLSILTQKCIGYYYYKGNITLGKNSYVIERVRVSEASTANQDVKTK